MIILSERVARLPGATIVSRFLAAGIGPRTHTGRRLRRNGVSRQGRSKPKGKDQNLTMRV
jgi:hypothetical protein